MQPLQGKAAVEIRDRLDGVVGQIEVLELRERRDGSQIRDGVVRQIEIGEIRKPDEIVDRRDGAALQNQRFQIRQRADSFERRRGKRRARQVERFERRQLRQDGKIKPRRVLDGQRRETCEARQIGKIFDAFGKDQLLNLPQLVGHERIRSALAEQLTDAAVQCGIRKRDLFDDASDRIACVDRVAYQTVFRDGDGDNLAVSGSKCYRTFVGVGLDGRKVEVYGEICLPAGRLDGDVNVLAVIAAFGGENRRTGT